MEQEVVSIGTQVFVGLLVVGAIYGGYRYFDKKKHPKVTPKVPKGGRSKRTG